MDVFDLRRRVIDDYGSYIRSFFTIRDARINDVVDHALRDGHLWPDPLVQLSPSFAPGPSLDDLIAQGVLHPETRKIFANKDKDGTDRGALRLHQHQVEGILAARTPENFVLTTGTGSGKSLSYIVPIVDHVLRHPEQPGIKAIVVYPMNALANSQLGELEKYLGRGYPQGRPPVTFKRYTGQESQDDRRAILAAPPDILLTNYVMLELLLTRPWDAQLIQQAGSLRFLVLDELHTYRGRQGADVSMLVRRLRSAAGREDIIHVGTSATLASTGTWADQQRAVAEVASALFGSTVRPEGVIGETLRRVTVPPDLGDSAFIAELQHAIDSEIPPPENDTNAFLGHPLARWTETTIGLTQDPATQRLIRSAPMALATASGLLAEATGRTADLCERALRAALLSGYRNHNEHGRPVFSFRLHQFVSRGDAVYASPEYEDTRHITLQAQQFVPDSDRTRALLPIAFCRECGQEYYVVRRTEEADGRTRYTPRQHGDRVESDGAEAGYLFINRDNPWPAADDLAALAQRLPDSWLEEKGGALVPRRSVRDRLPQRIFISADAVEGPGPVQAAYFPASFLLCLRCGVAYDAHQTSDFAKLSTLGSEGRSTATTLLTLSTVRRLRREPSLDPEARKLLSFMDNRQDASLQAGHFNDFVEIGLLRSALWRAIDHAGPAGISHDELVRRVFEALGLTLELYALNPAVEYLQREETDRALREVIGYYLYRDLRRGWRITSPNLEQSGLLQIDYRSLPQFSADARWQDTHPALAAASPGQREEICRVLLDFMRRELAIRVPYLNPVDQESLRLLSGQYLVSPWSLDDQERLETQTIIFPRSRGEGSSQPSEVFLSPKGGFGLFLRRMGTLPGGPSLKTEDIAGMIPQILEKLVIPGLVHVAEPPRRPGDVPGYQLNSSGFVWKAGDGTQAAHDPIRIPNTPDGGLRPNPFFQDFYRQDSADLRRLTAREHTAQVPSRIREQREEDFRTARLPLLFCSPTMELGVDIAQLNVVNLRNVPPTPANYAQRSGRAGRSGQPAFILTYCSAGSPHDQYFFRHPEAMVSGAVTPPRIDLENEELLRAHVHAIWLAESRLSLGTSLRDVIDVMGDEPTLEVLPVVASALSEPTSHARALTAARRAMGSAIADLIGDVDNVDRWLDQVLRELPANFSSACDRWRTLYRAALRQMERQSRILRDASRDQRDRETARRLMNEAIAQRDLLIDTSEDQQSDFYSYRYFASEGFLPGYNFPRLPLSAYLPGRKRQKGTDNFLSRPRFLAINEFGPRSLIYHEGSRYVVNKVILAVDGDDPTRKQRAKICESCGYLHPMGDEPGPDICEQCLAPLGPEWPNLFRMQNVSTRRRDRINSDEEERFRLGYELRSGIRFAVRHGVPSVRGARIESDGEIPTAELRYGAAATLWRMNLGWRRRQRKEIRGYLLDIERGYWARSQEVEDDPTAPADPMSPRVERVVPYVEDTRNALIVTPDSLETGQMASLESALKLAIQVLYQLEERELGSEPLPSNDERKTILFYEASEGGAGVLRRLVEDPAAIGNVARKALEILHFDPETGADQGRAPGASERCEAGCYNCLLSYFNQRDHRLLDRHSIRDVLLDWSRRPVQIARGPVPRPEQVEELARRCQSDLDRRWLALIDRRGHRLPEDAQAQFHDHRTPLDFFYRADAVAIFVDGPHHDTPAQQALDREDDEMLGNDGITVIRFHHAESWEAKLDRYSATFGPATAPPVVAPVEPPAPPSEAPAFDATLFDDRWHPALGSLASTAGVIVRGGEEVMRGGRSIDLDLATIVLGDRSVRLVDLDSPNARPVAAALEEQGHRVLRVQASSPDIVERVLGALRS